MLFPAVGALLGLAGATAFTSLAPLGPLPSAIASLALVTTITGALHEDGLADTFDALGAGGDVARKLDVMKDSRIGAFGAIAVTVSLTLRASLIARLGETAMVAWPIAAAFARTAPVWLMQALPYVTRKDVAKSAAVVGPGRLAVAAASLVASAVAAFGAASHLVSVDRTLVAAALCSSLTLAGGVVCRKSFGGVTGDLLGATEQLCETLCFAVFAWGLA